MQPKPKVEVITRSLHVTRRYSISDSKEEEYRAGTNAGIRKQYSF